VTDPGSEPTISIRQPIRRKVSHIAQADYEEMMTKSLNSKETTISLIAHCITLKEELVNYSSTEDEDELKHSSLPVVAMVH
jgi:hypothetical protein